jgi:hypothetical protein
MLSSGADTIKTADPQKFGCRDMVQKLVKVLKSNFFIILSCGQLNLESQSTIRNFKKASNEF